MSISLWYVFLWGVSWTLSKSLDFCMAHVLKKSLYSTLVQISSLLSVKVVTAKCLAVRTSSLMIVSIFSMYYREPFCSTYGPHSDAAFSDPNVENLSDFSLEIFKRVQFFSWCKLSLLHWSKWRYDRYNTRAYAFNFYNNLEYETK